MRAWPLLILAGCGDLRGLEENVTPLVRIEVQADAPDDPPLRVALVWGAQYLSDIFCLLPPASAEAAAVVAAGCRDPFGFVPQRVGADAPVVAGEATFIELIDLPAPDVMVGDLTARLGQGSFVLYEDVNKNGTLDLVCLPRRGRGRDCDPEAKSEGGDVIHGASFVTMTEPDVRLAFREGGFNEASAFYPRVGCPAPPTGFSVLGAGGFSQAEALAALLRGELPAQDPATCTSTPAATARVPLRVRPTEEVSAVGCGAGEVENGFAEYDEPPYEAPDPSRPYACVPVPDFGMLTGEAPAEEEVLQVVIAGMPDAPCKTVTHWLLKGCENDARCSNPEWDYSANPPTWWPCPTEAP